MDYTYEDIMQAICCALAFGSDAASAARHVLVRAALGESSEWGLPPDQFGAILMPGAGNVIRISGNAMRLLAEADKECDERCKEIEYRFGRSTYDLRRGQEQ